MKLVVVFLFALAYVESRKLAAPIDKKANVDFINMEGGGAPRQPAKASSTPITKPMISPDIKPAQPLPAQPAVKPVSLPAPTVKPVQPTATVKPVLVNPTPAKPVPVYPALPSKPGPTPGPGSVKQLITYYDSQGKASVIRPYSYSQAVNQG